MQSSINNITQPNYVSREYVYELKWERKTNKNEMIVIAISGK